ncbi:MAG: SMP-30/gluconolactonase/LRE family protein [Alphaproteobacteria bacterium]
MDNCSKKAGFGQPGHFACLAPPLTSLYKTALPSTGGLYSFSPTSGRIEEKASGLAFANGVALGPDEEYVLVAETAAHRISRIWLKGPKAPGKDVFIENLPGYPDNISYNGRGIFWVALAAPRSKALEDVLPNPFLRMILYRLQLLGLSAQPAPVR